jgi:hypothetical protein
MEPINDNSGAWEKTPIEGVSFLQAPQIDKSY